MKKETLIFYKTKWFLWIMLIFLPPVGIALLWICHNEMVKKSKVILTIIFSTWFIFIISTNDTKPQNDKVDSSPKPTISNAVTKSPSPTPNKTESPKPTLKPIYENAEIKDVMNGTNTDKIGEYSIIEIDSKEVTEEVLADWYFNYVVENDYNWCMILFTNKNNNMGVYATEGIVQKNVTFLKDKNGEYSLGNLNSKVITYSPTKDRKLKELQLDNK